MSTFEEAVDKAIEVAVNRAVTKAKLAVYPVGSLYLSLNSTNPSTLFGGTWSLVGSGKCIQGADSSHTVGTEIKAGLPNITGTNHPYGVEAAYSAYSVYEGAFYLSSETGATNGYNHTVNSAQGVAKIKFDASKSNSIYGSSTTVQPPALAVNIWKRTA